MSKEYEKFRRENEGILEGLLDSLNVLLDKFNQGIIPGEPEKSDAMYMLDVYGNAIKMFYYSEPPAFQRILTEKVVFDEEASYKELSKVKEGVSLLLRLNREKLIDKDDEVFQSEPGKALVLGNYCDEIIYGESDKHYYSLSSKAEKALKSKSLLRRIRKDNVTAIVPKALILDADKWTNLSARRIELLKRYYDEKEENIEYILFTSDDSREMVFGCELSDSVDVKYTFASIFDEKIDEHISQIKGFADSGHIDNIVMVTDSEDMISLLENEGINEELTPNITIVRL